MYIFWLLCLVFRIVFLLLFLGYGLGIDRWCSECMGEEREYRDMLFGSRLLCIEGLIVWWLIGGIWIWVRAGVKNVGWGWFFGVIGDEWGIDSGGNWDCNVLVLVLLILFDVVNFMVCWFENGFFEVFDVYLFCK